MDFASLVKKTERVVIIRSSYPRHLAEAIRIIKEINPRLKISVLVMPRMRAALTEHALIDEVIALPADYETYPPSLDPYFTGKMRQSSWPLFIILYNRANQCGYESVEKLARSFQPRQIWGLTTSGQFISLDSATVFLRKSRRLLIKIALAPVILPLIFILKIISKKASQ